MKYVGCTEYVEKKIKTEKSIMESCRKPVLGTMTRRRRRNL
jgi:capsular polysaccharide biosynthesis protein